MYSVKYRKGPTREEAYDEMENGGYGGMGRGGYSPDYDMSGIGGGTYYDGSGNGRSGGRDKGRERSPESNRKRSRHDRDKDSGSSRRRH